MQIHCWNVILNNGIPNLDISIICLYLFAIKKTSIKVFYFYISTNIKYYANNAKMFFLNYFFWVISMHMLIICTGAAI